MTQRILITGAGGYIGTTLIPLLLEAGYDIIAVDTFWFGRELLPHHPRLDCVTEDTRQLSPSLLVNVDAVIDLAALSNDPCGETYAHATWAINHRARVRTATLARQAGVRQYLLASSCSVYGYHDHPLTEASTPRPLTAYAHANVAAEQDILSLSCPTFSASALRLATLFGVSPRMRLDLVVNSMCYSAWRHGEITVNGGGTQVRPLLHVRDAAQAFMLALRAPLSLTRGEIFNVGHSDQNLCINDIAEAIATFHLSRKGRTLFIRHSGPQDMRSYHVSFDKLNLAMGWEPSRSWAASLDEITYFLEQYGNGSLLRCHTLDWYRHNTVIEESILTDHDQARQASRGRR